MKLTPKQKAFADYYIECGNATEAARKAGYQSKSLGEDAAKTLKSPKVSAYIAERLGAQDKKRVADADEVMEFYTAVMRGEVKDQFCLLPSLTISRRRMRMSDLTKLIAPSFYGVHHDIKAGRHTHYWLKGGRGSTKSSFISVEIILGMMQDTAANALVLRKVAVNLKDSVYEQLLWAIEALGVEHLWKAKLSPLQLSYIPTGQRILFRGADEPKKIKSTKFRKGYCKYIWYEEADEFAGMQEIRTINQSLMRGGSSFFVFYSYNPPKSQSNWVNRECLQPKANRLVHTSDYRRVPPAWLGDAFLQEAEYLKELNEKAYRHEYLGEVVGSGGAVFDNVTVEEIADAEIAAFDRIYNGVDWGFYPDPWAFNRMHYDAARRTLYIFGELTRHRTGNAETARLLRQYGVQDTDLITADSAEPKSVADYRSYGLFCRGAVKGPGSVDYSMKWLQALVRIVIDPVRCPDTAKEFTAYEYDRNKAGEVISGYPDRDNHHIDAVRYGTEPIWKRRGQ